MIITQPEAVMASNATEKPRASEQAHWSVALGRSGVVKRYRVFTRMQFYLACKAKHSKYKSTGKHANRLEVIKSPWQ